MRKRALILLVLTALVSCLFPGSATAETLEELQNQEQDLNQQAEGLLSELEGATLLSEQVFAEIEVLNGEVAANQEALANLNSKIEQTQGTIAKRKELIAERMQDLQLSGASERNWQALLEAESFSDFIGRYYAMNHLQSIEKEKIEDLNAEQEYLQTLQSEQLTLQETLTNNQTELNVKSQEYIWRIDQLKTEYADNQDVLATVIQDKRSEEERLAAEAARAAAAIELPSNSGVNYSAVSDPAEYAAKEWIAYRESTYRYDVYSVSGQHYGRYQLLLTYLNGDLSPENQERTADWYVANRYGSWCSAKVFWEANGWY